MSAINSASMDRHLKKIYDCLNIGCNKKAVQEVDRLPKNVRDLTVFKALKSLALIRMYKRRQAFEILNEINPDDDLDEVTLQTMTSCYKESVDVIKIVDLYEAASTRKPNDPEIMAHLFMAHVRVFNFKRQKEIALQMYKLFGKKKRLHSFWAIMSLVMQAQSVAKKVNCTPQDEADRRVCLSLAEKMCEKMIDDERTNEEIELYLIILRKQNKHEDEYKFLTGPICLRITDHLSWYNRRRAYLCLVLKMYSRAFKHYFPTLIQEYPDQIEYYQGLFKSAFLLDTEAPSQQQPVAVSEQQQTTQSSGNNNAGLTGTPVKSTSALAECYDVVEKQCVLALEPVDTASNSKGKGQLAASKNLSRSSSLNPNRKRLLRGPFIARIELYHLILSSENVLSENVYNASKTRFVSKYPTLNSLLLDYFQAFSKKITCYYDMDYMINLIKPSDEDKENLVEIIGDWLQEMKKTPGVDIDMFFIELNYHMLKFAMHRFKSSDSRESRMQMAKKFIDFYDTNRHLGKQTNKTEFQPTDNYCLLAANTILTNAIDCDNIVSQSILSDSVIVSLIVMLENAISNSPSNHQLKLCLLKLYSFIGASKQCSDVLLTLDIKHFQIDTLGHLLNPVLYNTGNYTISKESLETCLEFYAHGVRECFEGLTTSYRDGRFSKIEEISSVLRRLSDSLNATQCVMLKDIVSNLNASTLDELHSASQSFDPFRGLHRIFRCENYESIRDNRDFRVLKSLHFETNALVQQRQSDNLTDEKLWLRLRYYLIRSAYIQLESKKSDQVASKELKHGRSEFKLMRDEIGKLETFSNSKAPYSYLEPEWSPFRWEHINLKSLLSLVDPLVFLSDAQEIAPETLDQYCTSIEAIISGLEQQLSSIDSLVKMKQALLSLTITVEFISLCGTSLISMSSQQSKSKSIPHQMMNKTEAQLTKLSSMIKSVDPKSCVLDRVSGIEKALLSNKDQTRIDTKSGPLIPLMGNEVAQVGLSKVKEKILESYCESLREIENTCRRKAKLLRVSG